MARGKRKYHGKAHGQSYNASMASDGMEFLSGLADFLAVQFPTEVRKAIYSTAYFTQREMKKEAFPRFVKAYGKPSELQEKRFYDKADSANAKGVKSTYGADFGSGRGLGRAFEYRKYSNYAVVGWLSSSAVESAERWQQNGSKVVTAEMNATYRKAAMLAKSKYPYTNKRRDPGAKGPRIETEEVQVAKGVVAHIPAVGAVINFKRGGVTTKFMPNFYGKYRTVIQNTLRRKIEEKLEVVARGSHEVDIKLDFDKVRRGIQAKAYSLQASAMERIYARQVNQLLKRIV